MGLQEKMKNRQSWRVTAAHFLTLLLWESTVTVTQPTDMPYHSREPFALGESGKCRVTCSVSKPTSCQGPPVTAHDSDAPGERTESCWERDGRTKRPAGKLRFVKVKQIKSESVVNSANSLKRQTIAYFHACEFMWVFPMTRSPTEWKTWWKSNILPRGLA